MNFKDECLSDEKNNFQPYCEALDIPSIESIEVQDFILKKKLKSSFIFLCPLILLSGIPVSQSLSIFSRGKYKCARNEV